LKAKQNNLFQHEYGMQIYCVVYLIYSTYYSESETTSGWNWKVI